MTYILGLSASLRNARFGLGEEKLINDLKKIKTKNSLLKFVNKQTQILLKQFFEKGKKDNIPFNELYYTLRKRRGDRGLSNSEAAISFALWSAIKKGSDVKYISLSNIFKPNDRVEKIDYLKNLVLGCSGILLSGPVYFGDRSSIAQKFFEFLKNDSDCLEYIKNKPFAGISVGAKRNGGQETTLIYQIIDSTNLGMSAIGNDFETTAQYGGTAVAGDIGTMPEDNYGFKTSISTGSRISDVVNIFEKGKSKIEKKRNSKTYKLGIWLLQDDKNKKGESYINSILNKLNLNDFDVEIINVVNEKIRPCIACDICPTHIGPPPEYRCIIKQDDDFFKKYHEKLINTDMYLIAAYSPSSKEKVISYYQQFIERTRYLRRDDYLMGNQLVAPLVISEIGSNQNLHIRMLTSLIRHQTILHKPLIAYEHKNKILNEVNLLKDFQAYLNVSKIVKNGVEAKEFIPNRYHHYGYKVSEHKYQQDLKEGKFQISDSFRKKLHESKN